MWSWWLFVSRNPKLFIKKCSTAQELQNYSRLHCSTGGPSHNLVLGLKSSKMQLRLPTESSVLVQVVGSLGIPRQRSLLASKKLTLYGDFTFSKIRHLYPRPIPGCSTDWMASTVELQFLLFSLENEMHEYHGTRTASWDSVNLEAVLDIQSIHPYNAKIKVVHILNLPKSKNLLLDRFH